MFNNQLLENKLQLVSFSVVYILSYPHPPPHNQF